MFTIVSGHLKSSPINYSNVSRAGLEDLDPYGCKTNRHALAHARDRIPFMKGILSTLLITLVAHFKLTITTSQGLVMTKNRV